MITHDVIVAGAGIPGLYAALALRRAGLKVLLLESSRDPALPDYSTAGIPAETLHEFGLPAAAINASIRHQIIGTLRTGKANETRKTAAGGTTFAYVLDFGKTKRLLGEQCLEAGVDVRYGEKALRLEDAAGGDLVLRTSQGVSAARSVIDATGAAGVLATQRGFRARVLDRPTIGMEYRLKSPQLHRFRETIATWFDAEGLPHGYGWVFADGDDVFKVGLIEYWVSGRRNLPSLESRLKDFIRSLGIDLEGARLIEKHGGAKLISRDFDRVRDGQLFAIGDTIGAINPFLAEGIRQGLTSARFAVNAILGGDASSYERDWAKFKGPRWKLAELFAHLCYHRPDPVFIDSIVEIAKGLTSEELRRLVFQYEFELIFKRAPLASLRALLSQRGEIAAFLRRGPALAR